MQISDITNSLRFERLEYSENYKDGLGYLDAKIRFLDYETDKIDFVKGLAYVGKVTILLNIIERVAQPVDCYEEDFERDGSFDFIFKTDNDGAYVEIRAEVRV